VHVTDRSGGVSVPPYDAFNLAGHVGDESSAVAQNRAALAARLGVPAVVFMEQVHGVSVGYADASTSGDVPGVDVLLTTQPGANVAALVADCVPVALTAPDAVAVVHAGRNGIAAGVIEVAVEAIRQRSAGPVAAVVGPAICGRCYEVPDEMQAGFAARFPVARSRTAAGTAGLDLPRTVRVELARLGVTVDETEWPCTYEDDRYYSYRRDGTTGRFAVVAGLSA
jgi:YfiH family protein